MKDLKIYFYKIFVLSLALLLAILACSIQLLPSIDLLKKSIRQTESYTQEFNYGLLPLKDGLRFFIADYFGNPVTRNYWGHLNYSETSGFVGTLTLPLIIYAYFYLKKSRRNLFFLILLPLSIILAFDNPISHSIYQLKIPLLTSSYASRILFVSIWAIAILSAFSLTQMLNNPQEERGKFTNTLLWSWSIVVGIILGTLLSYFIIWDIKNLEVNSKYVEVYLRDKEYFQENFLIALKNSLLPFALTTLFLLILKVKFLNKKIALTIAGILLVLLSTFDLSRYFLKFNPFVSGNLIFPKVPALEFLTKQPGLFRVGREHAETFPPNTWIAYNLQSYEGYDPIYLNQYGKFMHFLNGGNIRTGNSGRYVELSSHYSSPFLDAANSKYFIAILRDKNGHMPGDILNYQVKQAKFNEVFKDKSAAILGNLNALNRAYFAPSVLNLDESKVMDLMMSETFDPRKTIALSKDLHISDVSGVGDITIIKYSPNVVRINTKAQSDEVLVLADQYEEGWQAKIDGKTTTISPANFIFRAVKVPTGSHQITFSYWPKSFDMGLKISLATSLLIVLLSLLSLKIKRF